MVTYPYACTLILRALILQQTSALYKFCTYLLTYLLTYLHDVYRVTTCRPGRGHIVAAARLQLVAYQHD